MKFIRKWGGFLLLALFSALSLWLVKGVISLYFAQDMSLANLYLFAVVVCILGVALASFGLAPNATFKHMEGNLAFRAVLWTSGGKETPSSKIALVVLYCFLAASLAGWLIILCEAFRLAKALFIKLIITAYQVEAPSEEVAIRHFCILCRHSLGFTEMRLVREDGTYPSRKDIESWVKNEFPGQSLGGMTVRVEELTPSDAENYWRGY